MSAPDLIAGHRRIARGLLAVNVIGGGLATGMSIVVPGGAAAVWALLAVANIASAFLQVKELHRLRAIGAAT